MTIPNVFHFLFPTQPVGDRAPLPFSPHHYFCLYSCLVTQGAQIILHTDGEISGVWWDAIKDDIEVRHREFSQTLDLTRLEVLIEEGGVYSDIDTIFIKSLEHLLQDDRVKLQKEQNGLPSNSLIASPTEHPFLQAWVFSNPSRHLPQELQNRFSEQLRLEELEKLDNPSWDPLGAQSLFTNDVSLNNSYLVNLCQRVNWEKHLKHNIRDDIIYEYNSTLNKILRRFVPRPSFDFTAVIPIRVEHQDRLENVLAVTSYLVNQLCVNHVIVVEGGERPSLMHLLDKRIRYIYVQQSAEDVWNKSKLVNSAMPWISTTAMAIWDADVLISMMQLRAAMKILEDPEHSACIPCSSMYHIKREFLSDAQVGRLNPGGILGNEDNILFTMETSTAAGLFMLRTDVFKHLRGLNEQYWGWGYEDDDMLVRVIRLTKGHLLKVTGPMFHFSHQRTENSWPVQEHGERSEAQRARATKGPIEQLRQYLGITEEIGSYSKDIFPKPPNEEEREWMIAIYENAVSGSPTYFTPRSDLPQLRKR